ncbi:portal protein [Brevundimonas diminuta]|uniref:portal protein n=1 Tax=Brevundimonas diminuta TaxID=293 RepID=UPI0025A689A8|nr:hypothetical protein [Brevundimonas diminuta]MDM8352892.1 hypothetical protein [Brevundimonas diminuta]
MEDGLSLYLHYAEEAEDATRVSREKAERDRDYYDGKQLTEEEVNILKRRGQPPIALNVIRARVDYLQGLEKKQRADPKAYPRNPDDQPAADAFTDGLRYAADAADYQPVRSMTWKNITVEGFGGCELSVVEDGQGSYDIKVEHVPWDRIFYDPHSVKPDFSDARYLGQYLWLDQDEALERARANGADEGQARHAIESTLSAGSIGATYDDKPKFHWTDRKRKRVRIAVMWFRKPDGWWIVEFTKGGILSEMPSPYVSKRGESLCLMVLESAYVDRDNNRYGVVRDLIDPQDEINKRRSKALHLMNVRSVVADDGAVDDVERARRELARPDGWITKNPGLDFEIVQNTDMAQGQAVLGQQAMAYVMQSGPNAALLGKGTEDQSGRAIEAQQAGGLIELGDLMDSLRRFDKRVFRLMAALMQQFWTAERWIRVTDDDLAPEYVGLNVPIVEQTPWGPQVVGVQNNLTELDMDIVIADAPDTINNSVEAYRALGEVLQMSAQVPPPVLRVMIEAHPALPTRLKKKLLDMLEGMSEPDPMAAQQAQMMQDKAAADIEKTRADAFRSVAQGEAAMQRASQPQMPFQGQTIGPIAA